jgi:hypothetical protein
MGVTRQLTQYARGRLLRRASRSIPWIGVVLALASIGAAMKRKGFLGGALDTALDATPIVGGAKNLLEAARGRDFIKDRRIGG